MFVYYKYRNTNMNNSVSSFPSKIGESVGIVDSQPKRDWVKWILIFALLAILGVNIFAYLGKITDWFGVTFRPLFKETVGTTANVIGDTTKQTISTAAEGTTAIVGGVAKGTNTGINELQKALNEDLTINNIDNRGVVSEPKQKPEIIEQDLDEADTSIVGPKTKGLSGGFCYIGEDRGVRSCMPIGSNDKCMSKQIYPTMEVCVNPNLRA